MRYVTNVEWAYLEAHSYYAKGILPNSGGWLEQPIKYGLVVRFVDALVNAQDREQAKKWQSKT